MTASLPVLFISVPEGIIDLGWGHPSPRLHPLGALQQATRHAFAHTQTVMLQYGAQQGFGPLLAALATFLAQAAERLARALALYRTSSPSGRGVSQA